jgi:hypothetical protein
MSREGLMHRIATGLTTLLAILVLGSYSAALGSGLIYPVHGEQVAVAQYTFDFTAFPPGSSTPFSETLIGAPRGPMTITYSGGSLDPGAFALLPSPLAASTLVGNTNVPSATLLISLSRPVYGIAVAYETVESGPIHMDLFSHGIFAATMTDLDPAGFFGVIPIGASLFSNRFDAVVLHTEPGPVNPGFFGISEVVALENVPEPIGATVLAAGFAGLVLLRRRCTRH